MKTMRASAFVAMGTAVALASGAAPASAHAFGTRYDLPIPLWLYMTAAGVAVALSFVVMALFLKQRGDAEEALRFDLLTVPGLGWLGAPLTLGAIRGLSVAVFALLLAAGFFGNPDTFRNIAPTFVWVVWWVGMAYISALGGNLWTLVNPWKILFVWLDRAFGGIGPHRPYPSWLGRWPAVLLFLVFAWMELISDRVEQPRVLAALIVAYSAITWTGMAVYGRAAWLANGEIFSAVYGLLARFAPTVGADGRWDARLPAIGLLSDRPLPVSSVCFVLLVLTTVTFDGVLETPLWSELLERAAESQTLRGTLIALQNAGFDLIVLFKTLALIVLPCVFVAVFVVFSHATAMFGGGGRVPTRTVVGYFVLSLVPIAIAYHLSHYLSYLLLAGQNIIPLVSDPFGLGWDLFGTAGRRIDLGIVNAKFVWYLSVTAIVIGHMCAVYVAHFMAIRVFANRGDALRSQIPMLVLMVGYTMISLWILSQPVVD